MIRRSSPDTPGFPQLGVLQAGIYRAALVNVAVTEQQNRPEQQSIKQRITDSRSGEREEQAKVTIEGDGIKTE